MKIDAATVEKTAHLARLALSPQEVEAMQQHLSAVLDWMDKLAEVDTSNVAPLLHISSEVNVMRNDEVGEPLPQRSALDLAPKHDSDYFRVPKVIE